MYTAGSLINLALAAICLVFGARFTLEWLSSWGTQDRSALLDRSAAAAGMIILFGSAAIFGFTAWLLALMALGR